MFSILTAVILSTAATCSCPDPAVASSTQTPTTTAAKGTPTTALKTTTEFSATTTAPLIGFRSSPLDFKNGFWARVMEEVRKKHEAIEKEKKRN